MQLYFGIIFLTKKTPVVVFVSIDFSTCERAGTPASILLLQDDVLIPDFQLQ
jgi:hypothetical protein